MVDPVEQTERVWVVVGGDGGRGHGDEAEEREGECAHGRHWPTKVDLSVSLREHWYARRLLGLQPLGAYGGGRFDCPLVVHRFRRLSTLR